LKETNIFEGKNNTPTREEKGSSTPSVKMAIVEEC